MESRVDSSVKTTAPDTWWSPLPLTRPYADAPRTTARSALSSISTSVACVRIGNLSTMRSTGVMKTPSKEHASRARSRAEKRPSASNGAITTSSSPAVVEKVPLADKSFALAIGPGSPSPSPPPHANVPSAAASPIQYKCFMPSSSRKLIREWGSKYSLATSSCLFPVPKVGIEPSSPRTHQRETALNRTVEGAADAPTSAPKCVIRGVVDDSLDDSAKRSRLPPDALVGVVETALAQALMLAAEAGRWELVAQLAEELSERHRVREGAIGLHPRARERDAR